MDADRQHVVALARTHGLDIDGESLRFNEIGLDYRVAFATDREGTDWVLRIPRRDDVSAKIADEAVILEFVTPRLTVAVPEWRIRERDLIAYPLLPGSPGLTLDEMGQPVWHFDAESPVYTQSFGRLLAELQAIDPQQAQDAGIPHRTPAELREQFASDLRAVSAEYTIAPDLREAWEGWLADEGLWPESVTFTHGELYPAHLLLSPDATIESVLDWTTARVADPAADFAIHHATATPEAFTVTLDAFAAAGGHVPARLEERCAAIMSAGPLHYALYAQVTGDPEHAAAAAAMLDPED